MNLKTKWKIRQCALSIISIAVSCTGLLAAFIVIKIAKYQAYGLVIYGRVPKSALSDPGFYFLTETILPLLPWFIATLLLDAFIVQPIQRKIF